jgi:hypothetical protein
MSAENLKKNQELLRQYPIITDIAWLIIGGALILFDVLDLLWILGAALCGFGVVGIVNKLRKKGDG